MSTRRFALIRTSSMSLDNFTFITWMCLLTSQVILAGDSPIYWAAGAFLAIGLVSLVAGIIIDRKK